MIQSWNWRGACDTARELESGGEHVMQSGNWRVARDSVWELEGCM